MEFTRCLLIKKCPEYFQKIESYLQQLPSEEAYNRLKLELGEKNDKYISLEQKFKLSQEQTENLTLKCSAQAKEINQLKLKLEESDNQLKDASRRANYDRNSSSSAKDTSNPLEEDVFKLKKYGKKIYIMNLLNQIVKFVAL